jgi:hypothetical protein
MPESDANPPVPSTQRGFLTGSSNPLKDTCITPGAGGITLSVKASDNTNTVVTFTSTTNYAAPESISTQSYSETASYNGWLGITQTTGLNGGATLHDARLDRAAQHGDLSVRGSGLLQLPGHASAGPTDEDGSGRPYADDAGWSGRAIRVERGTDSTHIQSIIDTVYAPCACSPLGKVQKVSQPYVPGGTPVGQFTPTTVLGEPVP